MNIFKDNLTSKTHDLFYLKNSVLKRATINIIISKRIPNIFIRFP